MSSDIVFWILRTAVTLCAVMLLAQVVILFQIFGNIQKTEQAIHVVVNTAGPVFKALPSTINESWIGLAAAAEKANACLTSVRRSTARLSAFVDEVRGRWVASVFPKLRDSATMLAETAKVSRTLMLLAGGVRETVIAARKLRAQRQHRNGAT